MNEEVKIKADEKPDSVPYFFYEGEMARMERIIKRLWILIIVLIAVIAIGIVAAVWYESQFETISYQQDGAGLNNICTGEQGDVYGAESAHPKEEIQQS